MRIFGLDISRANAPRTKALSPPIENRGGWFPIIREGFTGAWQRNVVADNETVLTNPAVFTCTTLIAHDISKMRVKLIALQPDGTWQETTNPAYSPVLRDPNPFQTDHQFWESWILSKLLTGNTYVLKERDNRNVVSALYVLDPNRVKPLVASDGSVFYRLDADNISALEDRTIVPQREMIHDRWNTLFHPLVGHSPIFAAALAARQGLRIQTNSDSFFHNRAAPSGILTTPHTIDQTTAERLKEAWSERFSGSNSGAIAVVGDDLKWQPLSMSAVDAQLIDQLKWTTETIAAIYHVPLYKLGIGAMPTATGIEPLQLEYYGQALQRLIEDAEGCLDRGLGLGSDIGVEFDLDGLVRMDTGAKIQALRMATEASIMSPNEARAKLDLPPVKGGEAPLSQQQYFSLEALAQRPIPQSNAPGAPDGPSPSAPEGPPPGPPPPTKLLPAPMLLLASSESPPAATPDALEFQETMIAEAQAKALLVEIYRGLT